MKKFISHTSEARSALLTSLLFMCVLTLGCSKETSPQVVKFAGPTMGTSYHITVVVSPSASAAVEEAELKAKVDAALQLINQYMSTYIPDSELMLLNGAQIGVWHEVSEPLADVLALSKEIHQKSDGSFDVTVGPLVNLWGFGPIKKPDQVPNQQEIDDLLTSIGSQHFFLEGQKVLINQPLFIDLSAIAKGYGVDFVANLLDAENLENYLVEIGGEIRAKGSNPKGEPWKIAIERPNELEQGIYAAVSLTASGMATSGDYRNYFEQDGKRFSHTIDPNTGYPITHNLASVTVIAETAAKADGWATALTVLGAKKGMEVAEKEQLAVYMIVKEGETFKDFASSGFAKYQ